MNEKIIIGSDHAGFCLKNKIIKHLEQSGYSVEDAGTYSLESCDYPVIAQDVANNIKENKYEKGILVCGTGIGMCIVANKIKTIRAAVVSDTCSAKMSRLHNNSNILCLGERIVGEELAKDIVDLWLKTPFLGERHARRVEMFEEI